MILYTVIPNEQVYPTSDADYTGQMMIERQGIPMIVQQVDQQYRIVRLMSSDPADYLIEQYCPGQYIK
ncbi:hypothetical protein JOC86_003443 [Bacillus pakistanensis]|uniref:Uncharacterized protein n=1 Tax=Rossellomorea pakistanensis TaxID=992288 RepID=A0ABS2NGA5_9BACI|nr:YlzJ-like family protein [Bacillus pakistanensis]MBM7586891.1 hypothetical protein [Bacillus pakistanensis]